MFYGVYYYELTGNETRNVYIMGYYKDKKQAQDRLKHIVPNNGNCYKILTNHCLTNGKRVGWINVYSTGDINATKVNCNSPHSSIPVEI